MADVAILRKFFSEVMVSAFPVQVWAAVVALFVFFFFFSSTDLAFSGLPEDGASGMAPNTEGLSAGSVNNDARLEGLFKQLAEGDAFQAARELVSIKDPRVAERLVKVLDSSEDEELRGYVIDALGDIGDQRALEPLVRMLEDRTGSRPVPEDYVKVEDGAAVVSLAEMSGGPAAMRRQSAARALGKIKDERAVEPLVQALGDENYILAGEAVRALAAIRSSRATDGLLAALDRAGLPVRLQIVVSLGEIQDERAVLPLLKIFEEAPDIYLREQALKALNRFSFDKSPGLASRVGDVMIRYYQSGGPRDRVMAVWSLGKLRIPAAVPVLTEAASGQGLDLRLAAVEGLANTGAPETQGLLEKLAADPDEVVRQAARKALERFRPKHD